MLQPHEGKYDLQFELTRADWLAVNERLIDVGPSLEQISADARRAQFPKLILGAPLIALLFAFLISKISNGGITFLEGLAIGVAAAIMITWGVSRINYTDVAKKRAREQVKRMDFSGWTGRVTFRAERSGVEIVMPTKSMTLAWTAVDPTEVGSYVLLRVSGGGGVIVPKSHFSTAEDAARFFQDLRAWWTEGQLTEPQRIARYLVDRDVACPHCGYNLRGIITDQCPECGSHLTIAALTAAQQ